MFCRAAAVCPPGGRLTPIVANMRQGEHTGPPLRNAKPTKVSLWSRAGPRQGMRPIHVYYWSRRVTSSISCSSFLSALSSIPRYAGLAARSNCAKVRDLDNFSDSSCCRCNRASGERSTSEARLETRCSLSSIWSATALLSHPRAISPAPPKT